MADDPKWWDGLEPGVELQRHSQVQLSIARSAKRQADALEIIAKRLDAMTNYFADNKAALRIEASDDPRWVE